MPTPGDWCPGVETGMRGIVLAVVAIQIGLAHPACAQNSAGAADRLLGEALPLFEKNHCASFRDLADQLYCGDPGLNDVLAKLNSANQERLNRLPNRHLAIEENAEWAMDRNCSCGLFAHHSI